MTSTASMFATILPDQGRWSAHARHLTVSVFVLATLCALVPGLYGQPAVARGQPAASPVVVVFDSSGSMWGELADNPQPKFALARRAIREGFGKIATRRPTGLIVFGRSCSTAAFENDVRQRDVDELLQPIDNLNPRGKGPLTLALDNALTAFPASGADGDIVVIHDGADNCGRDACSWAEATKASHPAVRVHLVSVGLSQEDREATRCVAERTGGKIVVADDAPGVATGLAEIAALLDAQRDRAAPAQSADAIGDDGQRVTTRPNGAAQSEDERAGGPARIVATVNLGPSGADVSAPVLWSIRQAGAEPNEPPLLARKETRLVETIAPGTYSVTARLGELEGTAEVTVGASGPARVTIPVDAGQIAIDTAPLVAEDGLVVTVTPATPRGEATDATADSSSQPLPALTAQVTPTLQSSRLSAPLVLATGSYWVDVRAGKASERRLVTVERGSEQSLAPFAAHGVLELSIRRPTAPSTRETPLTVLIEADAPERPDGRRVVARTAAPESRHVLPAGTYYVTLEVGRRRTSQLVAVPAGRRVSRAYDLQSAVLEAHLSLKPDGMSLRRGTPLTYAVEDLTQPGSPAIAWSADPRPIFHLAPGRYRIVARIGAHNVVASSELTLGAGQTADVTLEGAAAEIRLAIDGAETSGERLWEVRTAGGDVVWRTNKAEPKALLAPGRYVVRCVTGNRILEGAFSAEAGTARTIALVAE